MVTPVEFVVWFVDVVYPVYVLVGCAVICGVVLGLGGRWLAETLAEVLRGAAGEEEDKEKELVQRRSRREGGVKKEEEGE